VNSLDRLKATFVPGTIIEVVEQTYIPALVGSYRRIEAGGTKTSYRFTILDRADAGTMHTNYPKRVGDVTWVDDSIVRISLDNGVEARAGHHVTFRILPA
jgi:hypothetical protein